MSECMRCNGADDDDELFWLYGAIDRVGWAIEYVMGELPWAYTIGLAAGFEHPELVVVGGGFDAAMLLLNHAGTMIAHGTRFDAPFEERSESEQHLGVRAHPVHPAYWETGLLAGWDWYYDHLGSTPSTRQAIQLMRPDGEGRFSDDPHHDLMLDLFQPKLDRSPDDGGWDPYLEYELDQGS